MTSNQTAAEQLAALVEGVRREAYTQGYNDARMAFQKVLNSMQAPDFDDAFTIISSEPPGEPPERKPAGHNREIVMRALSRYGRKGATQAVIIREARVRLGETLAQSSTRHALKQLKNEGKVSLSGKHWRLISQEGGTAGHPTTDRPAASSNSNQGGPHGSALAFG